MGDLTREIPKPMLKVAGKTLLEHKLDILPEEVGEVIIVVGYLGHIIHDRFGGEYRGKRMLYVEQENPTGGTAEAVWKAKELLKDRFFVMNGDNLYAADDLHECMRHEHEWSVLVQKADSIRTGAVQVSDNGLVTAILENSDHDGKAGYASTGLYMLDRRLFDYQPVQKASGSSELGLPQTIVQAAKDIPIHAVPATFWFEIKAPEDLARAEEALARTDPHA